MSNDFGYAIPDFKWTLSPADIKEARERHNMSQTDLARALGVTREAVKKWEKPGPGGSTPTKSIRRRILDVLDLELGDDR